MWHLDQLDHHARIKESVQCHLQRPSNERGQRARPIRWIE